MTNTSNTRLVYLDDVMGRNHVAEIEYEDGIAPSPWHLFSADFYNEIGWPSVGLRMSKSSNFTEVVSRLLSSKPATTNPPEINIYTSKTMPARYHFNPSKTPRIAPLWVVPHIGWAITNHHEHEVVMAGSYEPKGVSHIVSTGYPGDGLSIRVRAMAMTTMNHPCKLSLLQTVHSQYRCTKSDPHCRTGCVNTFKGLWSSLAVRRVSTSERIP